jgi:hypothetical protein
MNSEPKKPRRGEDDDSWESLAENLFGIEFSRHDDADDLISPDELFPEEETPVSDEPDEASARDLTRDDSTGEGRAGELAEVVDSPEESPVSARRDDEEQYWDVLREWAADVSEGDEESHWSPAKGKRKKRERSGAPDPASSREEPSQEHRDEFAGGDEETEEFLADSDFAAGLLEGEPSSKRSRPPRRADRDDDLAAGDPESRRSEDEGEPAESERHRSRRRRRGRRGRPEAEEPSRAAAAEETGSDQPFGFEEGEERPRAERDREESREQRERRPRRRRRDTAEPEERPARRPPADDAGEEEVLVDWNAEPMLNAPAGDEAEDEDDEREAVAAYRGIPTWEEAIACLLNPSAPEPRSGEREPGGRSSGREGSRRRRRRR